MKPPTYERLDSWIDSQAGFPDVGGPAYPDRIKNIAAWLDREVHRHVEKGALLQNGTFLTDHGPDHIRTVVARAGDLLAEPVSTYPQLTAYEVYLLLMAIQFHDVGNVYGREAHEEKVGEIMRRMGSLVGDEMVEKVAIKKIARAHGGAVSGSRDTIVSLPRRDLILHHPVRYQALAAILRLADELSDDSRRAARFLDVLDLIPAKSRVYHRYSESLHSVGIDPTEHLITLKYCVTRDKAGPICYDGETVYLIDEIYRRTIKMHYEREYCMRYTRGLVHIDAIDVEIEVYATPDSVEPCIDPIAYRLQQMGYPGDRNESIGELVSNSEELPSGCELFLTLTNGERTT